MKIYLHFMQAVCKAWYFCKYHEKWKRRAKVGSEALENVAINRMTNVKHGILSNYYFYLLQFSESCDKNSDSAPGLLPTFAMKNHSVLGSGDMIQARRKLELFATLIVATKSSTMANCATLEWNATSLYIHTKPNVKNWINSCEWLAPQLTWHT